ncbi:hypothetical protein V6C53_19600 [Desulfocurvibacter africanus]|uniref:hypothetical protein n=1 Tax=Desulfocurvibacter africanus TaxID=873 RepID=UPI000423AE61|nr:hypothetical protein [Desulfocurvibacter africanus]
MATNAQAIKDAILREMEGHDLFDTTYSGLQLFVECVAKGIYAELQKLEDIGGTPTVPPATAHK